MSEKINKSSLQMSVEAYSRTEILEERFDRHLNFIDRQITNLDNKVERLKTDISKMNIDLINELKNIRVQQVKDDRATNAKIYSINGLIAFLISFFTAWFQSKHGG